ncbi:MAG: aldehyde dehydrogenase family protein, partial [Acidimicrobiales bacterium]|nr:aldehyde dehydrogenase family protein [Acidimicrobiales bacterium]
MPSRKELFIGGKWVAPESGDTLEVVNPRTEEPSGQAPIATAAEVDAAVAAARAAFEGPWRAVPFEQRVAVLEKARDGIGRRTDEIAEAMEAEQGAVAAAARAGLIPAIMRMMDVAIDCARQVPTREVRRDVQGAVLVAQEPKGVVSAIVPFNGPLPIAVLKSAPALLAGCPVVLKASELTPLSVFYLA